MFVVDGYLGYAARMYSLLSLTFCLHMSGWCAMHHVIYSMLFKKNSPLEDSMQAIVLLSPGTTEGLVLEYFSKLSRHWMSSNLYVTQM